MITFVKGNLFDSAAQVITNTVNCVGVMGKGVALEFKNRYPALYEDYRNRCKRGEVRPGEPYLWENDSVQILNFPTKRDWRENSRVEDIEQGLQYLAKHYQDLGIQSLAMPALGCGNGGLSWMDIQPLIIQHLGHLTDLDVYVYEPSIAASGKHSGHGTKNQEPSSLDSIAAHSG